MKSNFFTNVARVVFYVSIVLFILLTMQLVYVITAEKDLITFIENPKSLTVSLLIGFVVYLMIYADIKDRPKKNQKP